MQSSPDDPVERGWTFLQDRFGVSPSDMAGMELFERSGSLWVRSGTVDERLVSETHGFRLLRLRDQGIKPTTYGLQFLGEKITKHRIDLTYEELLRVLDAAMIPMTVDEDGYVALVYEGQVLGCGYYRDGLVSSRIPKGRAATLRSYILDQ